MRKPVGILDIGKGCRYPLVGSGMQTEFCGKPRRGDVGLESYCEEHHKLCRVPPKDKRLKRVNWNHKTRVGA
jgi:hypothetical protein